MRVLPINERGKIRLEDFQLSFKKFIALKLFESISKVTSSKVFINKGTTFKYKKKTYFCCYFRYAIYSRFYQGQYTNMGRFEKETNLCDGSNSSNSNNHDRWR